MAARSVLVLLIGVGALGCRSVDSPPVAGASPGEAAGPATVSALGRLEPKHGIVRIAGGSRPTVVIARLLVEEGDRVTAGQPIAILDTAASDEAQVARTRAELTNAETDLARTSELFRQGIAATSLRDAAQLKVDVARAELKMAQSVFEGDTVRSPLEGRVIKIHARPGERVGPDGIAELAETDTMYAIAEVYETDIGRVKVGQHATMKSPAFDPELTGSVERIGMKIGKLDVVDTNPAARTDARIVEVEIRLDDSRRAASLSNLQVEVAIRPD